MKEKSIASSVISNPPLHAASVPAVGVVDASKKCDSAPCRLTLEDYGFSKTPLKSKRSKKHKLSKRSLSAQ